MKIQAILCSSMLKIAGFAAPPRRKEWIDAMKSEIRAFAGGEAMKFAAGCVVAAAKERASDMFSNLTRFQVAAAVFAAGLAALTIWNAGKLFGADPLVGLIFAGWGAFWATTGLLILNGVPRIIILGALSGIGFALAQFAASQINISGGLTNGDFIGALGLEALALTTAVLAFAIYWQRRQAAA